MAVPTPDKRVVYLHCRPIFSGADAQLRRQKKVRQLLTRKKASISTLTHEFSIDAICIIAKELLEDGVFGSETKARLRFPELFKTSEAQLAERQASEALAAQSEAEAIEELIASSENDEDMTSMKDRDGKPPEAEQNEEHVDEASGQLRIQYLNVIGIMLIGCNHRNASDSIHNCTCIRIGACNYSST